MYVSFILVKHLFNFDISFQIIIAFVNNANATEEKNHAIIYNHIAEWIVLFVCKINS